MNAKRKSDEFVVPATAANNGVTEASAESSEGRNSAKRNVEQAALLRTPCRIKRKSRGLLGVRETARKDSTLKFTALLHHVNEACLYEAFFNLKKTAAVGVDGVTWQEYERKLEANIADLHGRIHRGAYRAQPSRRTWIPKADGRQRPLGIASLEDKIVQQAVLWVLQSIYEQDFLGFSYGFRPGRSQHDALDALSVAITSKRELDIGCRYRRLLRHDRPRMVDQVFGASNRRSPHFSADSQVASRRSQRRRRMVKDHRGCAARLGDITVAFQRVPALCV